MYLNTWGDKLLQSIWGRVGSRPQQIGDQREGKEGGWKSRYSFNNIQYSSRCPILKTCLLYHQAEHQLLTHLGRNTKINKENLGLWTWKMNMNFLLIFSHLFTSLLTHSFCGCLIPNLSFLAFSSHLFPVFFFFWPASHFHCLLWLTITLSLSISVGPILAHSSVKS